MNEKTIYLRMRHRVQVKLGQDVKIGDIAQVVAHPSIREELIKLPIHHVIPEDKNFIIIDVMKVVLAIERTFENMEVQSIGAPQTILEVKMKRKRLEPVFFILIWFLLFVGAGLAIMNFHADVSMQTVHQKIFKVITGNEVAKPLLLQIPYSIGLGLGMLLFFNHVFKKRLNEEPSPLEVEMFNYQQALDQYIVHHENSESEKKLNGR